MSTNKKNNTKWEIINISKKYFYLKGYKKSKMQDIADEVGIALGSLTYHFKKKENIVSYILKEYLEKLYMHTQENSDRELNALELHFYASIPYYKNLLTEEKTKRFFYEFKQAQSTHTADYGGTDMALFITNVYYNALSEYRIRANKKYLQMAQNYGYGGRTQLVIDYVEGSLTDISIEELSNFLSSSRELILGVPKEELERIGHDAIEFNRYVDFSHMMPLSYEE